MKKIAMAMFALLAAGCGEAAIEPSDEFRCGPTDAELAVRIGVAGLPRQGPRRVRFVMDAAMSPEMQAAWGEAIEAWRAAVESACPFEPEFAIGATSPDLSYDGTTANASPKDVVELRVDDPQPGGMEGNGWSWPACRSGRATIESSPKNAHRTTRHELGHALGALPHDATGEPSLMAVSGEDWWHVVDVMPADVANYAKIWCGARPKPASGESP